MWQYVDCFGSWHVSRFADAARNEQWVKPGLRHLQDALSFGRGFPYGRKVVNVELPGARKDCWIPTLPRKWSKVFHDSLPSTRHELVSFFCAVPWLTMSLIVSRYSRGAVPAKPPASWEGWSATRVVVLGQVSMSVHTVSVKELSLLFVRKPGWSCLKRSDLKSSLW